METTVVEMSPLLVPVKQACTIIGRGQSALYELIGAGKIRAVKSDGRTLIVVESLREYAASLPPAKVRPPRNRRPQRVKQTLSLQERHPASLARLPDRGRDGRGYLSARTHKLGHLD